jgi:hypothetical protein
VPAVPHSIFGFTNIFSGAICIGEGGDKKEITALTASEKLHSAGIVLSVFGGLQASNELIKIIFRMP